MNTTAIWPMKTIQLFFPIFPLKGQYLSSYHFLWCPNFWPLLCFVSLSLDILEIFNSLSITGALNIILQFNHETFVGCWKQIPWYFTQILINQIARSRISYLYVNKLPNVLWIKHNTPVLTVQSKNKKYYPSYFL